MNEDYVKLVATVQHFYEKLLSKNESMVDSAIANPGVDKKAICEKAEAINEVLDEYENAFKTFLYKEDTER